MTKADFNRSWGIPPKLKLRFKGVRGVYWYYFSRHIRQRDFKKFGGECIDQCGGRARTWEDFQGGHFIAASKCGPELMFDEMNVHGQLPACNNPNFSPHSSIGFALGIKKRYGEGVVESLWARREQYSVNWPDTIYIKKLREMGIKQDQTFIE